MKKVFILIALFAIAAGANAQLKVISGGKVGIGTNNPFEKLQIGDIWTFHNGGTKYIGRNVTYTSAGDKRIENGYSSQIRFENENGNLTLATAGYGLAGSSLNITGKNLTLDATGNVGIGITNPSHKLDVKGSVRISDWTDILIDWNNTGGIPQIYPSATWYLNLGKSDKRIGFIYLWNTNSIDYGSVSDERSKENIRRLDSPIEKIKKISAYNYNFKKEFLPDEAVS